MPVGAGVPAFRKALVANRGAVASRVIRSPKQLGGASAAVYSEADRNAAWIEQADESHVIGPASARDRYLNQDCLLEVGASRVDALHPGCGFLSENAGFARHVRDAGITFIGPDPQWIEQMGEKTRARDVMVAKVIAHGADRGEAIATLADALRHSDVEGIKTNLPFLLRVLSDSPFDAGALHTGPAAEMRG